ncbi:glycine-rich domain-containing protein [Streptomyces sp. NPDC086989]|uniref:glycine-rich domain-containing protein n=1 Tax=Streptomyces sp. NPDC086989 TaxID=3365764 RepID=UPI003823DA36
MTITQGGPAAALTLISPELRAHLIADVRAQWPELTDDQGERGVTQMVAFLVAGARTRTDLSPSKPVDTFWHAFIARTRSYRTFSDLVAGGYIDHEPADVAAPIELKEAARDRTVAAITAAGFPVDEEFWPSVAADCSQCYAGCSNSPAGGQ